MNKIIITLIALFLGIQINLLAQKHNEITHQELVDIIGSATENTYLKDFKINLEPNDQARFSVVLSKNTVYSLAFYQNEPNQFEVNLYSNKSETPITPSSKGSKDKVMIAEYEIDETGVYHLFVKNIANKEQRTCVLLSFVNKFKPKSIEKTEPEVANSKMDSYEKEDITKEENTDVYFVVENMPKFKDKENKVIDFKEYLKKELHYPQEAKDKNIEGTSFVQFTVNKDGYVKNAKVIKESHPALDQEALRIIYSSPKWEPGTQNGNTVDVILTYPVIFKIKEK